MSLDTFQSRLLNEWQRGLPLESRPYDVMAEALGATTEQVIGQLAGFCADGTVSRVGPVFRPNSIGASCLVAVAVPPTEIEAVAALINAYVEVNHNYEREHVFNLWFVVTAESKSTLQSVLDDMEQHLKRRLLRLPLVRDYHIDLGFPLSFAERPDDAGSLACHQPPRLPCATSTDSRVRVELGSQGRIREALVAGIQSGLPLVRNPYRVVADELGCTEQQVIDTLAGLLAEGTIKRLGVIVRHHELGYRANAMVVWDVPDERVDGLGQVLGAETDVTLCYRRPRVAGRWPYNLFCMIHGQDRVTVETTVQQLRERHGLQWVDSRVLFSGRRFKQRGARYRPSTSSSLSPATCSAPSPAPSRSGSLASVAPFGGTHHG